MRSGASVVHGWSLENDGDGALQQLCSSSMEPFLGHSWNVSFSLEQSLTAISPWHHEGLLHTTLKAFISVHLMCVFVHIHIFMAALSLGP